MTGRAIIVAGAVLLASCGSKTGLDVPPCDATATCCVASEEVCNDLDDDCDGFVDDGLACFFVDGEPIEPIPSRGCGADWYGYGTPDAESANPMPDIRLSDQVVVGFQHGDSCPGASLAVIADLPMDETGGELMAEFEVDPPRAAGILVSDDPFLEGRREDECVYDRRSGRGSCTFVWQPCCTDGVLLGAIERDACITMTLSGEDGVSDLFVLDGRRMIERSFGSAMELCVQIRPAR